MVRATRSSAVKVEPAPNDGPKQLSSPPATPVPRNARKRKAVKEEESPEPAKAGKVKRTPKSNKRVKKTSVKEEESDDLPHNLGAIPDLSLKEEDDDVKPAKSAKNTKKAAKSKSIKKEEVEDLVSKAISTADSSPKAKSQKPKNTNYGLIPGQSPYPNYPHPTPEECAEVHRLLSKAHGAVSAPKTIPAPSLSVSGCGEVPSVLDALIRTRLSAATSNTNSSRAFAGLVQRFGVLDSGIGKGSVDWNAVRVADQKDVFEAIKSGGLADVKSKDIQKILQMVWEENRAQQAEDARVSPPPLSSSSSKPDDAPAKKEQAEEEEEGKKQATTPPKTIISLDHLHALSSDEAFTALVKYPGIGPKTASCVLLFCLQRPSFAVDTHVFRLCKWLRWVPGPGDPRGLAPGAKAAVFAGASRTSTYAHCEVRVPDHLKYALHYLLIRHGKMCPRCRAITGEASSGWEKGCPIEHLVKRGGGRKGGGDADGEGSPVKGGSARKRKAGKKAVVVEEEYESDAVSSAESEAGESVMSDLVSDEDVEPSEDEDREDEDEDEDA
ncbi:hypothetical protein ACN47E_007741 [Coniothyrium glycines]